ncbi:MAG TPA: glycosyltransferase [Candidatus Methylomirabilis sp.]|nr:glycosyltransferase [Candidatus Methylomirabilis sp.]
MEHAVRVTVVVETENEREAQEIRLGDVLQALSTQTYPAALTEFIVVDSGEIPALATMIAERLPAARIVNGTGLTEYQMKNLAASLATADIVAYCDGDCAPARGWIAAVATSLGEASPDVVGVQGRTVLRPGLFSRQLSVLLYGWRTDASGRVSHRIVSDNCAFRRDFLREQRFEPDQLPSTPETVLWTRTAGRDLSMIVNEAMRSTHDYPTTSGLRGLGKVFRFFWQRAYSNGYCMTQVRFLVSGLRAGWIRWLGPVGPPILVAAKMIHDVDQIVRNSEHLGLTWRDWIPFSPVYVAYYAGHLVGGYGALLRCSVPRS